MHTPTTLRPSSLQLITMSLLAAWLPGCFEDEEPPSQNNIIIVVNDDMATTPSNDMNTSPGDMDMVSQDMTPSTPDMALPLPDMPMTPMCSVGEMCGDSCVDTQSDIAHCGMCGNTCDEGSPCVQGVCEEQVSDCRQEACQGFFYCDLANGNCLEGCDRDDQCQDNATCDVFAHACTCEENFHECASQCVDSTSPQHCGDRCEPCATPANGSATCEANGSCGIVCDAGFHACGDQCVADNDVNHCGNRCNACPTDPRGEALCNASNQCEIACDDDALLCNGSCAACPAGAIDKVCQGSSCVVPDCPSGERRCGGLCTACPTAQGIAATTCSAQNTCVVQSCQSGLTQCNNTCSTCPSQGVSSTACNTSDECVIDSCNSGLHPCGDSCCTWAASPTLIGSYQSLWDFKMVRDENSISMSFTDTDSSSFTDDTGYHITLNGSSWVTAETYDLSSIPSSTDRWELFAWRQNNQNYALIEENNVLKLISPSGQNGFTELGSLNIGFIAPRHAGLDGSIYVGQKLNGNPEVYHRVTPSSNSKFTALPLNTPDYADAFFFDAMGTYYGVNVDATTFNPTTDFWEQISTTQIFATTFKACGASSWGIVVDEAGFGTVSRRACGNESFGNWLSTQKANGQWDHFMYAGSSDFLGNLTIAPDGTVHTCIVKDTNEVYHVYRAPNALSTWQSNQIYSNSFDNVLECSVATTSTGEPYVGWVVATNNFPLSRDVYVLAPN